jgi:hypothetical protein
MHDWFRARALSTGVALLVLAGAASGPPALYLALTADDQVAGPVLELPDTRAGVAGQFASLFVAGWLRGDDVSFFNPSLSSTPSGLLVERVGAVRTTESGRGLFDVVVAADLIEYVEGSEEQFRPIGLRFYAVGVAADGTGDLAVLGPPSVVEAPDAAGAIAPVISELQPATAPDLAGLTETLDGFFAAYLTGTGDVRLFTSPNSLVGAVEPAPFGQASVRQLGWGPVPGLDEPSLRLARVAIDGAGPSGTQQLEYSMVLAERDGRWEISQILNSPVVVRQGEAE